MKNKKIKWYHVIEIGLNVSNCGMEFYLDEFYVGEFEKKWRKMFSSNKIYLNSDKFMEYSVSCSNLEKIKIEDENSFPLEYAHFIYVLYDSKLYKYLEALKCKFDENNTKIINLLSNRNNYKKIIERINTKKQNKIQNDDKIIITEKDFVFKEDRYKFYKTKHEDCNRLLIRDDYRFCPTCAGIIEWG